MLTFSNVFAPQNPDVPIQYVCIYPCSQYANFPTRRWWLPEHQCNSSRREARLY